ncbi:MAG: lysine--tRNA ligase [bacterium]|nr:lysine--tRNA ligase [bacterium]
MDKISSDLIGQRNQRIEKMQKLRELGINPFPSESKKDHANSHVVENFEDMKGKSMTLAGRLMKLRDHGKLSFGNIQDQSGQIQIALQKDQLEESLDNGHLGWSHLNLLDVGDIVQVTGALDKTQQGEITLFAKSIKIIAKSIRPLPNSLSDKEAQFRRRYIDLEINSDRKELFKRKALFYKANRDFLLDHGFIEVETPVLEHVTGGADAAPFVTHHNALDQNFYLRISTELYQKRLIGAGFEKIFTIGPNFRNEGLSDEHLQEYYQVEWYWAYANYQDNMNMLIDMLRHIANNVYGKTTFTTRGHTFDLADEWKEVDYADSIKKRFNIDIFTSSEDEMIVQLKKEKVELAGAINRSRLIDNLWKVIRKEISGPAFLVNEPAFMSPLAKAKDSDPRITERFHIILAGSELGNGYTEINDPEYQLQQFLDQQKLRESGDDEAQMLDIDYVEMLEYGMPPVSGYGHSERIFWFFEDVTAREGTLFPQMRREVDQLTKELYPQITFEASKKPAQKSKSSLISNLPSKQEALTILEQHVQEPYQRLHAKMVARAMASYAKKYEGDEDLWYITGLLHDLDYDKHPDEHPNESLKWFSDWGYPTELIDAVSAHAFGSNRTTTPPKTQLDFALIACDELSGLLYAYSLMRPTGFEGMEAKSVKKKFKDKAFAAKIDREEIMMGVEGLGIELGEHMINLISVFSMMEEFKK